MRRRRAIRRKRNKRQPTCECWSSVQESSGKFSVGEQETRDQQNNCAAGGWGEWRGTDTLRFMCSQLGEANQEDAQAYAAEFTFAVLDKRFELRTVSGISCDSHSGHRIMRERETEKEVGGNSVQRKVQCIAESSAWSTNGAATAGAVRI